MSIKEEQRQYPLRDKVNKQPLIQEIDSHQETVSDISDDDSSVIEERSQIEPPEKDKSINYDPLFIERITKPEKWAKHTIYPKFRKV